MSRQLEQLRALEDAAELARRDRAAYAVLSPEQRRGLAEQIARTRDGEQPTGPALFLAEVQYGAMPRGEWLEDADLVQRATAGPTTALMNDWLAAKRQARDALRAELEHADRDYGRRAEAAQLGAELAALEADVSELSQLDDLALHERYHGEMTARADSAGQRMEAHQAGDETTFAAQQLRSMQESAARIAQADALAVRALERKP